jgi:hypothetical protein
VDGLGLLAVDRRPVGRRGRRLGRGGRERARTRRRTRTGTLHGVVLLPPPPAGDLLPRAPRRPDRHPVQPVAQQVGVADRTGLAGQDEEDGLEGVLGMLRVAQDLAADAQHHRTVPAHQRRERGLAGRVAPAGGVPLQELAVR